MESKHQFARGVQNQFLSRERPVTQKRITGKGDVGTAVSNHDRDFFVAELADPSFHKFVGNAYESDSGVSYRINPVTGEKEMMVAGTRSMGQWGLNLLDTALYGGDKILDKGLGFLKHTIKAGTGVTIRDSEHIKFLERLDRPRQKKEAYYSMLAEQNNVDVIYGHSRGGSMVADMDFDGTKVGLDSAMLIAGNTDMINLNEGGGYNPLGLFDAAIGLTGEQNIHMDQSMWSPHQVWGS